MSLLSNLELKLICDMMDSLFEQCDSESVSDEDIKDIKDVLLDLVEEDDRYTLCSNLETTYYMYSILLSEIRQKRRDVMTTLFQQNPKLAQEKSVLKEKLDAEPEYATLHKIEEQMFQFLEHLKNIKNNIIYLYKDGDNINE